jgi:hypothetical protein
MFCVGRLAKSTTDPSASAIKFCPPASLFAIVKDVTTGSPDGIGVGLGVGGGLGVGAGVGVGVGVPPPGVGAGEPPGVGVGVWEGAAYATSFEGMLSTPALLYAVAAKK